MDVGNSQIRSQPLVSVRGGRPPTATEPAGAAPGNARPAPDIVWDAQSAAKRLYVSEKEAFYALAHLTTHLHVVFDRSIKKDREPLSVSQQE